MVPTFRELHATGCFVLPNPWDPGSARMFASLGYRALASTSAGLAFALGRPDLPGGLDRDVVLANVAALVGATPLPVQADFQDGYGPTPEAVHASVTRCVAAGVAGLSIEDAAPGGALYPRADAVARLRAARAAIDASGSDVVLTGRAESFLVGVDDPLRDALHRLEAYADAGADCLYAPGLRTEAQIRAVVALAGSLPVNVLAADPTWTVRRLAELGVRRVSVGSAFARVAWAAVWAAARDVHDSGSFASLASAAPFAALDALFADAPDR